MMADYIYTADEKRIIHRDGWMFFVRDSDKGGVEIGYREWDAEEKRYKAPSQSVTVALQYAELLANALQFFADRESDKQIKQEEGVRSG